MRPDQAVALERVPDAVVIDRGGYLVGQRLHRGCRVAHGDARATHLEHLGVVPVVADADRIARIEPEVIEQLKNRRPLVDAGRSDLGGGAVGQGIVPLTTANSSVSSAGTPSSAASPSARRTAFAWDESAKSASSSKVFIPTL